MGSRGAEKENQEVGMMIYQAARDDFSGRTAGTLPDQGAGDLSPEGEIRDPRGRRRGERRTVFPDLLAGEGCAGHRPCAFDPVRVDESGRKHAPVGVPPLPAPSIFPETTVFPSPA
jgi:hypothetical protein